MKNPLSLIFAAMLVAAGLGAMPQSEPDKLGLPGDNLNLYGVMKLFQESQTLEGFEKQLNNDKSFVNNLDLDGNSRVDYLRVTDNVNNNLHIITLNIAVNEHEDQDVAVLFVEKRDNGQILVQLLGDEDLYGKDYFIEPVDQTFKENYDKAVSTKFTGPNIAASWPILKFLLAPNYVVWPSPWRWGYYPAYWKPAQTQYWHLYNGYHHGWQSYYTAHFRRWNYFRNPVWFSHYYGGNFRSRSVTVKTRSAKGDYKATYSHPSSFRDGYALFAQRNPKLISSKDAPRPSEKTAKPTSQRMTAADHVESDVVKDNAIKKKPTAIQKKGSSKKKSRKGTKKKSAESRSPRDKRKPQEGPSKK